MKAVQAIIFVFAATASALPLNGRQEKPTINGIKGAVYRDFNFLGPWVTTADNRCINLSGSLYAMNNAASSFVVNTQKTDRCFFYKELGCAGGESMNTPNSNGDLRSIGFNDNISSFRCN